MRFLFFAIAFSLTSISAFACLHYPMGYRESLRDVKQQAFLFHDGTNAHMVVATSFFSSKLPREVAWVLPLPSVPSEYHEIKGPFFEELNRLMPVDRAGIVRQGGIGSGEGGFGGGIKVHPKVLTESYEVQPIEILSDDAGSELNSWLKKHKYNPMPMDLQKPYLKKGAAFLAIRMQLKHPIEGVLRSAPLHLVYAADRLTYPLRLTHATRQFDLDLFVFSKNGLKDDLKGFYLRKSDSAAYKNEGLFPFLDDILKTNKGSVTLYRGYGLNSEAQSFKGLIADPEFPKTKL